MNDFRIHDVVEFLNTSDKILDGKRGEIVGKYMNNFIVMFSETPPDGYYPTIVITGYFLKKVTA